MNDQKIKEILKAYKYNFSISQIAEVSQTTEDEIKNILIEKGVIKDEKGD